MGKETREHINKEFNDRSEPLPYPADAIEGLEVEEVIEEPKKKGKK